MAKPNYWRSDAITRHMEPPISGPWTTSGDMGVICWKNGNRRSSLKLCLTKDYRTTPRIRWTLWEDFSQPEDRQPNYRIVFSKTQISPAQESGADFIGQALREWIEGVSEPEILAKLPESDPLP